ncbi:MAG TPA: tetratricopeptide repeat protein [Vicinamibacterales bacterium]|nr:tetratricopeptide repeat protein [Vicinamibacterales bacterium]
MPRRWIGAVVLLVIAVAVVVSVRQSLRRATAHDAAAATGRAGPSGPATPSPSLKPVTLPDLSKSSPAAQKQISQAYAELTQKTQNRTYPPDAAGAYGNYGMLLMAAEYYDEAIVALNDAEALAPGEMRWPYMLAHIYRMRGATDQSAAAFERALRDKPDYAPALVWLGNAYLDQGRPDAAAEQFSKALMLQPRLVAALFGRGRASLAQKNYEAAIADLEQALEYDPSATAVHYPLAMAYRGAGQIQKAQSHLLPQGAGELKPPDPVLSEVDGAIESPVAYELRGDHALQDGQWDEAIAELRRGLTIDPSEPALRHKLATALAMKGDTQGAIAEFRETIRRTPSYAKSHYSLALVYEGAGQIDQAAAEFTRAIAADPNYVEAHLQLAQLLRHNGEPKAALPHFEKVVQLDPRVAEGRYGYAMALVQLKRYADARDVLLEGTRIGSDHPGFAVALARLLAAAPDASVRDGARALQLLQGVPTDTQQTFDWGVTMAMALAENGRFDDAVRVEQQAVSLATGRDARMTQVLTDRLRLYEQHRACREPWAEGEPMELVDRPQDAAAGS